MEYRANWERACLLLIIASSLVVLAMLLVTLFGTTPLVGLVATASVLFWLLVALIALAHSASSIVIRGGIVTQLSFGREGMDRPLSELIELELRTAMYPGILRFNDGTEFHVSGIAVGKNDELLQFVEDNAPNVEIKRGE